MIYASFSDYTDLYYGSVFDDEDAFITCASRASDYLNRLTMNRVQDYISLHPDSEEVKKATCALAEVYAGILNARANAMSADGEIASESVGSHSVSYRSGLETAATLEAELRKVAQSYLAMTGLLYRGISNVYASYSYVDYS